VANKNHGGLGKGLGALLQNTQLESVAPSVSAEDAIQKIPVKEIQANRYQPRQEFDESAMEELSESIRSFTKNCAAGITADREKMHHNLHNSLMLVTALNPYIGYKNSTNPHVRFEALRCMYCYSEEGREMVKQLESEAKEDEQKFFAFFHNPITQAKLRLDKEQAYHPSVETVYNMSN